MRLWHKSLIHCLPRQQLIGQWRECCAIASNLATKHFPNHILVNKIMDYSPNHFLFFCNLVIDEMKERGYKIQKKSFDTLVSNVEQASVYWPVRTSEPVNFNSLFYFWHNKRYLIQCYYNLQEKYDCHAFQEKEWDIMGFM